MITLTLTQLQEDKTREEQLIAGFSELLSIPKPLLSSDAEREISEASAWSQSRLSKINAILDKWSELSDHGYPERQDQIVPDDVLNELQAQLRNVQLAVAEFKVLTVSSVIVEG